MVSSGASGSRIASMKVTNASFGGTVNRSGFISRSSGSRLCHSSECQAWVAGRSGSLPDPGAADAGDDRLELEDPRGAGRLEESLTPELDCERERAAAHSGDGGRDEDAGRDVAEPADRDHGNRERGE